MNAQTSDKSSIYEMVWREFRRKYIYELAFLYNPDSPDNWLIEPERAVHLWSPKENNFFEDGFPLPGLRGSLWCMRREFNDKQTTVFMDDLFLCPNCGAFHHSPYDYNSKPWFDRHNPRIDPIAMSAAIEERKHKKEFDIQRCRQRKYCTETVRYIREKLKREEKEAVLQARLESKSNPKPAKRFRETVNPFVTANGSPVEAKLPCSIEEFLVAQKLLPRSVVVEHNGEAVAPSEFSRRQLNAGDRLEIVKIVAGG